MSESAFVVAGANIGELPDAPKYNIKAVCSETGIRPVTLRAWERRYKLLEPHRTRSNYRLYSERDVAVLRWLKSRVDSGLPISTAATELAELRRTGAWPETAPALPAAGPAPSQAVPPAEYAMQLYAALVAHSENTAAAVLAEAAAARAAGVTLSAIGLGMEVDDAFLTAVAGAGSRYFKAPMAEDLARVYGTLVVRKTCP